MKGNWGDEGVGWRRINWNKRSIKTFGKLDIPTITITA